MRLSRLAICAVVLALLGAHREARAAIPELPGLNRTPIIRSWSTSAGLPQNTVNAITQTRDGYMWLGTRDGLVRFDGVRFKTFGLEQGLPGINIRSLYLDAQDTLWIGTYGSGLASLQHGRITPIVDLNHQPGSDIISALQTDAEGRLWVGTDGGLRFCRDGKLSLPDPVLAPLLHASIYSLLASHDGRTMWISTYRHGLQAYHDGRLETIPHPAEVPVIASHAMLEDRDGRLWVSVGNGMVLLREQSQWRIFRQSDGLPFAYVTSLAQDAEGTVWAGSLDAGLYRFDGTRFQPLHQSDGLSAEDVCALHCDPENNLWVGTRTGGLNRLSHRNLLTIAGPQGLTNDYTHGIAETPDGTLWIGTVGGSLYSGNLADGFAPFRPADYSSVIYYYSSTVNSLHSRPDGSLWWSGGVGSLFQWKNRQLVFCLTNEPWQQNITFLTFQEDLQGGLWMGGSRGRLVHYQNGQFTALDQPVGSANITSLAVEPGGGLWVGCYVGGLKYLPPGATVTHSPAPELDRLSIRTLYLDAEKTLWIGTDGAGLGCWYHGRFIRFKPEQGLDIRSVAQIIEDDNGFLWLGSSSGIYKVNKHNLLACAENAQTFVHLRAFGVNDGMLAEECVGDFSPAGLKTSSGLICIPTVKGLVVINPEGQRHEPPPPPVLLEEVMVNQRIQYLTPATAAAHRPSPDADVPRIVISPGNHDVEIHYTAIEFSAPEKIGFRYRMDGLDTDWRQVLARRSAPYHLPPGFYTFHVEACNPAGIWSEQDTSLSLIVLPYFWETSWFRVGCLVICSLLVGTLTWGGLRRRYRLRLERLQTQNAIERERLRISKDMHDHVGGMLTQVSQLSDMTLGATGDQDLVRNRIERIADRARAAVQALDEIVWATNPKNDNLSSFAEYVSRFSDEFFEHTPIRCWQEIPATLPPLPLRADVRHNVFLAVREAFNNALKHSHCTELWLRLKLDDGVVTIEVDDNGRGFSPGHTPSGDGLENMRARLHEEGGRAILISAPGKGTRIRFTFPLSAD